MSLKSEQLEVSGSVYRIFHESSSDRQKNGILQEIKCLLYQFIFTDSSVLGILFLCPLVWILCTKTNCKPENKKDCPNGDCIIKQAKLSA